MSDTLTHSIVSQLADDWRRETDDGARFFDPALGDDTLGDASEIAGRLADDLERDVMAIRSRIRLAARPFAVHCPALVLWRDGVLSSPRKHAPPVVAAALETVALECELAGHVELAQRARAEAESLILNVRRSA